MKDLEKEVGGVRYIAVESKDRACQGCVADTNAELCAQLIPCASHRRADGMEVIWLDKQTLKSLGEPMHSANLRLQEVRDALTELVNEMTKDLSKEEDGYVRQKLTDGFSFWRS